jgi:Lon protease-like protein
MVPQRIPIFPLNVVLFPEMPLPLHIFEPRYQEMLRVCRQQELPFGVCLIRNGVEVGGPAAPFSIGTIARILTVKEQPEGRADLMTLGGERFRIVTLHSEKPYLEAEIETLPQEEPGELQDLPERARVAARRFMKVLFAIAGEAEREVELPDDPRKLSYVLGALLQAPNPLKQELLECGVLAERLRQEVALLEEDAATFEAAVQRGARALRPYKVDPKDFRLN